VKAQLKLPHFDEDLSEESGWEGVPPVTEYHGTTDAPGVNVGGLQGKVMGRHRAVRPPPELEDRPVVYTTSDKEKARQWAQQRAKTLGTDPAKIGVFGVRGDLESTEQEDPKSQFSDATTRVHSPDIPRERLTVVKQQGQPTFDTRQEEAPPETDESLDVGTGVSMEENDPCCEAAKQMWGQWAEERLKKRGSYLPFDWDNWMKLPCDSFHQNLEEIASQGWTGGSPPTKWVEKEKQHAARVLQEWDACVGQQFSGDMFTAGEGSAGVLVSKHATSPEALRHKYAYGRKYEADPKQVKYRGQLLAERRKRGIAGKGGPDMSHTKRGTLVAEDPHANRARHFKERGTLKSVGVRKARPTKSERKRARQEKVRVMREKEQERAALDKPFREPRSPLWQRLHLSTQRRYERKDDAPVQEWAEDGWRMGRRAANPMRIATAQFHDAILDNIHREIGRPVFHNEKTIARPMTLWKAGLKEFDTSLDPETKAMHEALAGITPEHPAAQAFYNNVYQDPEASQKFYDDSKRAYAEIVAQAKEQGGFGRWRYDDNPPEHLLPTAEWADEIE